MKYLGNADNLVRTATVTATNIAGSDAIRQTVLARTGGGDVQLVGPYTGQADTTIDVEVISATIAGTPRTSAPVFRGVGNGTMTAVSAPSGMAAQVITVTLVDLGTETRAAYAPFAGVTLRAKVAGSGGNAIQITVDASGITTTATDFALLDDIARDQVDLVGQQWDWGHAVLEPEGTIPASAPRLRVGIDPQVYRAYKRFAAGRYLYSLSPAPVRPMPQGSAVALVSGTYTVTIADGVTTRTYTGVTTLYSLLAAIQADASCPLFVVEPVVNDLSPGGMGAVDLSVVTGAFVAGIAASGSGLAQRAQIGLVPDANAPTEELTIRCVEASRRGQERWEVVGTAGGALGEAITGVLYDQGAYAFTVPAPAVAPPATGARVSYDVIPFTRGEGVPDPCIRLDRLLLGTNAADTTITYTYKRRPAPSCECDDLPVTGNPNPECLGEVEEVLSMTTSPLQQQRVERISRWVADIATRGSGVLQGDEIVADAQAVAKALQERLRLIFTGTPQPAAWAATTSTPAGTIRRPTTPNGLRYQSQLTGSGTTGSTQPTWPTTEGGTVTDGSVTWTCIGRDALAEFDLVVDRVIADFGSTQRQQDMAWEASEWRASEATFYATAGIFVIPTARNGRLYRRVSGQASAGSEPTWPTTDYATVTESTANGATWMAMPRYWTASQVVAEGTVRVIGLGLAVRAIVGGATGGTEPTWVPAATNASFENYGLIGSTVSDGGVTWRIERADGVSYGVGVSLSAEGGAPFGLRDRADYIAAITSQLHRAIAAAGLTPDFEDASNPGTVCWQDSGDDYWWVPSDPRYLPAFTGVYYHAAIREQDAEGNEIITPTREFGFGIQACDHIEGDAITIRITGTGQQSVAYVLGDTFTATVIAGSPVQLGGGQTGNDTLTWQVVGSVDGGFDDYALNRVTPNTYTDTGGLSFLITPGARAFALGDRYTITVEGGTFQWRRDGGEWSSPVQIAPTVALADGLSAAFVAGTAPSHRVGDSYRFKVEATYGPGQLRSPTTPYLRTTGATVIEVTPAGGAVSHALIAAHTIPSSATIRLQGSDDNFATTPFNQLLTWRRDHIHYALAGATTYAKWRVTVSAACTIGWLWLGAPLRLTIPSGVAELGTLTKRLRVPGPTRRRGLGVTVSHSALTQASVDALYALLEHAGANDRGRLAVIPNDAEPGVAFVTFDDESLDVTDELGHQPRDVADRLLRVSLDLQAVA